MNSPYELPPNNWERNNHFAFPKMWGHFSSRSAI